MNPLEINELQKAMMLRGVDYETSELIIQDFRWRCVNVLHEKPFEVSVEDLPELWKAYALEKDENMTRDAQMLAAKLRAAIAEIIGIDADRINEIMRAEREGRLVILPCKIGDTLFMLKDGKIYDGTVRFLRWEHHKDRGARSDVAANPNPYFSIGASFGDFGKTVFLSREEAGKALEEAK